VWCPQIETPTETIPVMEHLTAARFRALWADLPRQAVLTTQVHGRCALVGRSGSVLRAERGDEIDEYDAVWRLDRAPTHEYEVCPLNYTGPLTDSTPEGDCFANRAKRNSGGQLTRPFRDARAIPLTR
jgi:hypothetical protein